MSNDSSSGRDGFAEEYPFRSHFVTVDGVRMHYVDEGVGEILLCVHGNPTWSFAWRNFIKQLSSKYRVIAVDHVGCGFSEKPQEYPYCLRRHIDNLKGLIAQLGLNNITLIAHDWGGAIGMGAAGELPDQFSRFVLCNTAAFRSRRIPLRIAVCRWPAFGVLGVRGLNLFARAALTMAVANKSVMTPAVRAGYLAPYDSWANRVAVYRFVQDIPMSPNHPTYETLVGVEQSLSQFTQRPMLLAWGEQDWCFTTTFRDEFHRRFPQAEVYSLPDAGHYLFEDAPDRIIKRLAEFLESHPLTH